MIPPNIGEPMFLVIVIAAVVLLGVLPIMLGARIVKAKNTGFNTAFLAAVCLGILSFALDSFVSNPILSAAISTALGTILLTLILGTSLWRGFAVSLIVAAVQIGAITVMAHLVAT